MPSDSSRSQHDPSRRPAIRRRLVPWANLQHRRRAPVPPGGPFHACRFQRVCDETIRRVGWLYLDRDGDWADYTQEAWLSILSSLAKGQYHATRGRLEDWLFIVARNQAISYCRRRWRRDAGVVDLRLDRLPDPSSEDPRAALDRAYAVATVRQAIERLRETTSATMYAVFQLRHVQDLGITEVARQLGLTPIQVRVYDHRARRELAKILVGRGFP